IQDISIKIEFRRARSNAVNITLDENCKHPSLTIKEKNSIMSSTQKKTLPKAVVVATEGFSEKKHYWEVEVGDKSEWELGVLCKEVRDTLRSNNMNTFPKGNLLSLQFSQGEYSLTDGKVVRNCKPCSVVGVFLDQEFDRLSFFDVEEKCCLASLSLEFSGCLYPFFSPGSDDKWSTTVGWVALRPFRTPKEISCNEAVEDSWLEEQSWGGTEPCLSQWSTGNLYLKLKNVQVSDKGKYICSVTEGKWRDQMAIELEVT
ncbi:PREDICTED: erythroid membrane-associated protein-like, partial [Cariama cristata]|uniref:erythroid membrane-associated protein-like n=1 Tax=Cariama cristata TaxID=54380 RepID=UPI00052045AE